MKPTGAVVFTFGRFQPPTIGHARIVETMRALAVEKQAIPILFASPVEDGERNPLTFRQKVQWLKRFFPDVRVSENQAIRNPFQALSMLALFANRVTIVVGDDQKENFARMRSHFPTFDEFTVVSVGRDGMSGTKLRQAAMQEDFTTFRRGIPTRNVALIQQLYKGVQRGLHGTRVPTLRHDTQGGRNASRDYAADQRTARQRV